MLLLDDPLSAVDSKVGSLIFYSAINDIALKQGACVVLGTYLSLISNVFKFQRLVITIVCLNYIESYPPTSVCWKITLPIDV